jgi:hypothetical protein
MNDRDRQPELWTLLAVFLTSTFISKQLTSWLNRHAR